MIGCPPNSVNLAMSINTNNVQEQSNTTTRIQCNEISFQNNLNKTNTYKRPGIKGFIRVNETNECNKKSCFFQYDDIFSINA